MLRKGLGMSFVNPRISSKRTKVAKTYLRVIDHYRMWSYRDKTTTY